MALSIRSNPTSALALHHYSNNVTSLSQTIERLSSGLRINRAADDPSTLFVATGIDAQAKGLGQAIRNANDGISIMEVVDGALAEAVDILNSIKTKAIQAAESTQTTSSRRTIQEDIDKLIEELDLLVKSTRYNDRQLLTGVFSGMRFQVGDKAGETIPVFLDSAESDKSGHLRTAKLSITNTTSASVELQWTAPGDDGNSGQAQTYDLRYSEAPIDGSNFDAATQVFGVPAPGAAGALEIFAVGGLFSNTTYYFAIKTKDELGNTSGISNVPSATTVNLNFCADGFNRPGLTYFPEQPPPFGQPTVDIVV